tara:strand:- start:125 stop:391 length:267 start_codon:yes stop_codon:yes gene_type:complete
MKSNKLTDKEYDTLWRLLEKANVLWQYYEKEHIAEDFTDEQWNKFLEDKQDGFADSVYETARICVVDFQIDNEIVPKSIQKLEEKNES